MNIWNQNLKYLFKMSAYLSLTIIFISTGLGCARTHKTTTTETTVTYPNKGAIYQGGQRTTTTVTSPNNSSDSEVVQRSETTTTTTETKDGHPGVLGSTLHAIGYIISLPFIIIRGVFRIIFGG